MSKVNSDEQGFSPVELLLVLIILILIGIAGYFVVKQVDNNKNTTPTVAGSYSGWKSYNDSYISFKYPSSWWVGTSASGIYGGVEVTPKQSTAQTFYNTPQATNGGKVNFKLTFYEETDVNNVIGSNSAVTTDCATMTCDILAVYPLHIENDSKAKLIIFNVTNNTAASNQVFTNIAVVDDPTAKLGPTTGYITVKGEIMVIDGAPIYEEGNSVASDLVSASVNNLAQFEQSSDFLNCVKILNSLVVK
ncbi:MAG TPA: hypothetical protein VMR95_00055 [Candidatus Binatia bacterium]|nr:hypothetical protein [Candidatus Binatia bacterium]